MAGNGQNGGEAQVGTTEREVLAVLTEARRPLDAIGIASRTRLTVEDVLEALETLAEKQLVSRAEPEPVHERFASAAQAG